MPESPKKASVLYRHAFSPRSEIGRGAFRAFDGEPFERKTLAFIRTNA
jgi:hypothetical protein